VVVFYRKPQIDRPEILNSVTSSLFFVRESLPGFPMACAPGLLSGIFPSRISQSATSGRSNTGTPIFGAAAPLGKQAFPMASRVAWIEGWSLELREDGAFLLRASKPEFSVDLVLRAKKPPVFHGSDGVSQKAEGPGRASHYYSFTRLWTEGTLSWDGKDFSVEGWSWYDHEWATNQLTEGQVGWDWFSLQFDDGSDLMLFQIRTQDGGKDPFSSGTWVDSEGEPTAVGVGDFTLLPVRSWRSQKTGGEYPIRWKIEIPNLGLDIEVSARMEDQEFRQPPISYWEGAVEAKGRRAGSPVTARGYLEMTGYSGPIVGMQAAPPSTPP
jgi:predicted secreted hydrolase